MYIKFRDLLIKYIFHKNCQYPCIVRILGLVDRASITIDVTYLDNFIDYLKNFKELFTTISA